MSIGRLNNFKRSGVSFEPAANVTAIENATASGPNYAIWTTAGDNGALSAGGTKNLARSEHGVRVIAPSANPPKFTSNPITYWIVGGGGGGSSGNTAGGGGGAGGYKSGSFTIGSTPISVIVGWGGTGTNPTVRDGYAGLWPGIPDIGQGAPTILGSNEALGGGKGAMGGSSTGNSAGPPVGNAGDGASGGGGGRFHPNAGTGTPGVGNPGGTAGGGCPSYGSGGGGGVAGAGENFACHPQSLAGRGGDGVQCPTTFRPFGYGAKGPGSPTGYFCGGGGGSNWNQTNVQHGGYGGGAGWQNPDGTLDPGVAGIQTVNAYPNSGGGGGGSGSVTNPLGEVTVPWPGIGSTTIPVYRGGNGGDGIIMITW